MVVVVCCSFSRSIWIGDGFPRGRARLSVLPCRCRCAFKLVVSQQHHSSLIVERLFGALLFDCFTIVPTCLPTIGSDNATISLWPTFSDYHLKTTLHFGLTNFSTCFGCAEQFFRLKPKSKSKRLIGANKSMIIPNNFNR